MIAIFGMDGTLALDEHRQHFLKEKPKNWKSFAAACVDDLPNIPVIKALESFSDNGDYVFILSGRSETVRTETTEWLKKYKINHAGLYMRKAKDYRDDRLVKKEMFNQLTRLRDTEITKDNTLVFDDRQKVVDMWREMGLTCCQVAPGDF